MFFKIFSAGSHGIEGYAVEAEADITKGIPSFTIVGLPNAEVKESKERIKSAITNSGFKYPNKKIVVNLSPADIKKEGSHYDLPLAIAILRENESISSDEFTETAFLGELSLDGRLNAVNGCTALLLGLAQNQNIKRAIIPFDNCMEACMIPDLKIYPAKNLKEVYGILTGQFDVKPLEKSEYNTEINEERDFRDVKGSLMLKRGSEIAAAGFHNMLMIGPPGSGKTMVASRLNTIMPLLNDKEYIQVSQIYSFLGNIPDDIIKRKRPFRSPHHTMTYTSLIGGGHNSKPGEVVLSHNGILFMDEFLEFDKKVTQGLRQPLEDKNITISRVNQKLTYPSDFLLVAATNPCPCGNHMNPLKECTCSPTRISSYLSRASAPLLDRIDIFMETSPVPYSDLTDKNENETSEQIRKRVLNAAEIQRERFKNTKINYNSQMNNKHIEKYCNPTKDATALLKMAFDSTGLTARSYHRVLKVARSIADMDEKDMIDVPHVAEALNFRKTFNKYWG